ncbi:unnamed protein product [Leptosia nina]|uniref:Uncharacterized protein n=1 Tax=Leptosia nina TaxID=320188 RepID=A0AAV1JUK5_9NEOP
MKFLIVFALVAAASAAPQQRFNIGDIGNIINAINNPSTHPNMESAFWQMLLKALNIKPPTTDVSVGPAIIEKPSEDISMGPAIIEKPSEDISMGPAIIENPSEDISMGPAIIEKPSEDISMGPAIIENPDNAVVGPALVEEPAEIDTNPALVPEGFPAGFNPFNFKGPLVQVVVNVDSESDAVSVDQINNPEQVDINPAPVIIDDGEQAEIKPDPVIIVDNEPEVDAENINIEKPSLTPEVTNPTEQLN